MFPRWAAPNIVAAIIMRFWRPSLFTVDVRSRAPESTRVDDRARSRILSGALRARCRVSARAMSLAMVAVLVAVHVPGTPAAHAAESCVDLPTRPFDVRAAGVSGPYGLWSDGATLWVANYGVSKLYAFDRASGERHASRDIVLAADNRVPEGGPARDLLAAGRCQRQRTDIAAALRHRRLRFR